jgi:hypothetical protein
LICCQKLLGDRFDNAAEIERALFLGHAGMKRHLQQQIAELFTQIVEIIASDRVGNFVGFFKRVRCDGRKILLEVPRASRAGRAQRRHDFDKPVDVARRFHRRNPVPLVGAIYHQRQPH